MTLVRFIKQQFMLNNYSTSQQFDVYLLLTNILIEGTINILPKSIYNQNDSDKALQRV